MTADAWLDAALELLDRGFSVIPVGRDKKPLFKWREFIDRRPTEDELLEWGEKYPDANLALILGQISGLVVADADGPRGQEWIKNYLPRTSVYATTARGFHAYYRLPEGGQQPTKPEFVPEVDIKAEGGYVVVPPSIHETGVCYEWKFVPELDGWEGLTDWPGVAEPQKPGNLNLDLTDVKGQVPEGPVEAGGRNNALARKAGLWFRQGLGEEEVLTLARSWNRTNKPPLGDSELVITVKSIGRKHQTNYPQGTGLQEAIQAPPPPVQEEAPEQGQQPTYLENYTFGRFTLDEPPEPKFVLENLLLSGVVGGVVARGGTGKSFFLLQLGLTIAAGKKWGPFIPSRPQGCLYINAEDPEDVLHRRAYSIWNECDWLGDIKPPSNFFVYPGVGQIGRLMVKTPNGPTVTDWYEWLEELLGRYPGVEVLVLDPMSRFFGLDENDNSDVTAFVAMLESFCQNHQPLTVIVAHHVAKHLWKQDTSLITGRGGSGLTDGMRWTVNMSTLSKEDLKAYPSLEGDSWKYVAMDVGKSNYAPELASKIFLERGKGGVLKIIDPGTDRIDGIVKTLHEILTDSGARITLRELKDRPEGKNIADLLKEREPTFSRKHDSDDVVRRGMEVGMLSITQLKTKTYPRDVIVPNVQTGNLVESRRKADEKGPDETRRNNGRRV